MDTQIKRSGSSKVIVLSPEFLKFRDMDIDDWVNIDGIKKVNKSQGGDTKHGRNI